MPDNNGVLVLTSPFCFLTILCSDKTVIYIVQALALVLKTTQVFLMAADKMRLDNSPFFCISSPHFASQFTVLVFVTNNL